MHSTEILHRAILCALVFLSCASLAGFLTVSAKQRSGSYPRKRLLGAIAWLELTSTISILLGTAGAVVGLAGVLNQAAGRPPGKNPEAAAALYSTGAGIAVAIPASCFGVVLRNSAKLNKGRSAMGKKNNGARTLSWRRS